jgi:hypothetical protein
MEIEFPPRIVVSGPTNCGKTFLITQMLTKDNVFDKPIEKIYYCAKHRNSIPDVLRRNRKVEFIRSLPNEDDDILENRRNLNTIFVIEDWLESAFDNSAVSSLFTSGRHNNIGVIITSQVLFPKAKKARNISLNASHLILFKNFRDSSSIGYLARQICQKNSKALVDLFLNITEKPYSYLVISCSPLTPDIFRISSNILSDPFCIYTDEDGVEKTKKDSKSHQNSQQLESC